MFKTVSVQVDIQLPASLAKQAEELQETDPDFLSRIVLYGLTRHGIYRHLRKKAEEEGIGAISSTAP